MALRAAAAVVSHGALLKLYKIDHEPQQRVPEAFISSPSLMTTDSQKPTSRRCVAVELRVSFDAKLVWSNFYSVSSSQLMQSTA